MDSQLKEQIEQSIREAVIPLVRTDGGEVYLVRYQGDDVHIHLAGACAGCPGSALTSGKIIEPALRSIAPKVRLVLTTGVRVPDGARKL